MVQYQFHMVKLFSHTKSSTLHWLLMSFNFQTCSEMLLYLLWKGILGNTSYNRNEIRRCRTNQESVTHRSLTHPARAFLLLLVLSLNDYEEYHLWSCKLIIWINFTSCDNAICHNDIHNIQEIPPRWYQLYYQRQWSHKTFIVLSMRY